MASALQNWSVPPLYVAIIGKGTLDHKDRMGYSDSFVPAVMIDTPWSLAASDYRLLAGEEEAGFTFGRIPVTNDEDGLAYVDKIKAYEASSPGSELYQGVLAADNPDDGGEFHANSDLLADRLVDILGFDGVSKFYHPQDPVRQNLILSATWDAGYVSYDGHGSATQVGSGSENFIKASDANALQNTTYPVFTALTCAAGDYTLPGSRSLAGSLVLNTAGGAIASLSPTGLSLDSDAQLLNNAFVDSLYGNNNTIGEAIKQARLQADGVLVPTMPRMYSIVGDPGIYAR